MAFCTHFYLVFSKKWSNFALVIELDRHIEILLLDNDCVIIPNFGGFVAHHVEARYDESEASFLPPIRTLGFNPHLKNINDSLLAQSYVEAYDISYPEAQRAIAADVDCIKEQLSEKGEYELKNIGVLSLNGAEDIVFTPCEAGILTPNLYGLGAVTVNKLVNNNETVAEKGIGIPTGEKTKDFTADSAMTISRPTEEPDATVLNDEDDEKTISIKVSWIRNIAVAAAAIVAFFVITTPVENSIDNKVYVSDMGTGILTKISTLDTPNNEKAKTYNKEVDSVIRNVVANKALDEKALKNDSLKKQAKDTAKARKPVYCIVMASQVTRAGADNYVKELKAEGYDKARTYINNKVVRVVYGEYETEDIAQKELKARRGSRHFEQAWIHKITHPQ